MFVSPTQMSDLLFCGLMFYIDDSSDLRDCASPHCSC